MFRELLFLFLQLSQSSSSLTYPPVFRNESFIEIIHNIPVPDPYRWLEDPASTQTQNFIKEQTTLSENYLTSHPHRQNIQSHLSVLVDYARWGAPRRRGRFLTYQYNTGLQDHDVFVGESGESQNKTLLDPNTLSEDGSISLSPYYQTYSLDGGLFAYALVTKGSDWIEGRVLRVEDGFQLPDRILHIKWPDFSFAKGGDGMFYARFPLDENGVPLSRPEIRYHRLGTDQEDDLFVMADSEHPDWFLFAEVSHDGDTLLIKPQPDFKSNSVLMASLRPFNEFGTPESLPNTFLPVFSALESNARFIYVTNIGPRFIFLSDNNAPNFHLIQIGIDLDIASITTPTVLVEQHPSRILKWAEPVHNQWLLLCYMVDVMHVLEIRHIGNGSLFEVVTLPIQGVVSDHSTTKERSEFFLRVENLVHPGVVYRCEILDTVICTIWREMRLKNVEMEDYVMEQVMVPSKDKTLIPLFIAHDKDMPMDGRNPALLYGYGGFNVDVLPVFNPLTFGFVSYFGGVYASASVRGGAEYGEPWHASGSLLQKQNSFDDFISCAEFLQTSGHTSPSNLAIQGSSNGGLLVGACINQRPDLFGVAFPDVGLMDMLRFHLSPIGSSWCSEYGCPEEEVHFRNLFSYSPVHNVKSFGKFPAVLTTTAENDDRVPVFHSFKYVATIQHVHGGVGETGPMLLKVTPNAGHSEGKPLSVQIEDYTDYYAFYDGVVGGGSSGGDRVWGRLMFVLWLVGVVVWVW